MRWNFDNTQNVANASFDSLTSVDTATTYPFDIAWNPDGSVLYVSGNNSGFHRFNSTSAFVVSGICRDTNFSVTVNTNAVEGFLLSLMKQKYTLCITIKYHSGI